MEVKQEQKSMKLVGRIRPHKGHSLFKYTNATGRLVKMEEFNDKSSGKKKVVIAEEGNLYVSALNIENAIKKLARYHGIKL